MSSLNSCFSDKSLKKARRLTRQRHSVTSLKFVSCGLFLLLATGCVARERPSPYSAFNEIAAHCLRGNTAYVRDHVEPALLKQMHKEAVATDADASEDAALDSLMTQLQKYRTTGDETPVKVPNDQIIIEATGVGHADAPGQMVTSRVKLRFHKKHGWRLASKPFDTRSADVAKPN